MDRNYIRPKPILYGEATSWDAGSSNMWRTKFPHGQ